MANYLFISRIFRCCFAAVLFLAVSLATGCVTRTTTSEFIAAPSSTLPSVTVAPFENLSSHRQAGLILTDLASTLLYSSKNLRVIEASSIQDEKGTLYRRLETAPWEKQIGVNTATALSAAKNLKADYVLAGSVGEYGFVDGFGETATVGVTLRLVSAADGRVVWAGSESARRASVAFSQESVHRLAHNLLRGLLTRMDHEVFAMRPESSQKNK